MIITKSFFSCLEDLHLMRLPKPHKRTYKDSSGKEFPTFERSGLCLSFTSNSTLYWTGRYVEVGYGESDDVIVRATALKRDPVDASNDAELLAEVLDERAQHITDAINENSTGKI